MPPSGSRARLFAEPLSGFGSSSVLQGPVASGSSLETLLETHEDYMRHELQHDRLVALVRVPARESAHGPAGEHVGLPVCLGLDPAHADVQRKYGEQVDRRI